MATRVRVLLSRSMRFVPVYLALLAFAFASLLGLGFAVASSLAAPASRSCTPLGNEPPAARRPAGAAPEILRNTRKPLPGGTWM